MLKWDGNFVWAVYKLPLEWTLCGVQHSTLLEGVLAANVGKGWVV